MASRLPAEIDEKLRRVEDRQREDERQTRERLEQLDDLARKVESGEIAVRAFCDDDISVVRHVNDLRRVAAREAREAGGVGVLRKIFGRYLVVPARARTRP